ncbi:MAG: hypothetical protein LAT82_00635 [Nanoarchaeota archaeon]|nr:hypothetical protein [Nanoarchaeota archaeon]
MSSQHYKEEDIKLVQEVVEKIIILLSQNSFKIIKELSTKKLNSFDAIIREFQRIIYIELTIQNVIVQSPYEFVSPYKPLLSKEIRKEGRSDSNSISSGVGTYLSIIIALFLISKGLEKHNFQISKEYFELLAYSSLDIIDYNKKIFGVEVIHQKLFNFIPIKPRVIISNSIPFLNDALFKLGGGACPYTNGKKGKDLNAKLITQSLIFLEQFYQKILSKYEHLEYKPNTIPDFLIILRGEFDAINFEHLYNNPSIFKKIN